jgi:hypothetical protein
MTISMYSVIIKCPRCSRKVFVEKPEKYGLTDIAYAEGFRLVNYRDSLHAKQEIRVCESCNISFDEMRIEQALEREVFFKERK